MTRVPGSKRWMVAAATAGMALAVAGCTPSEPDDGPTATAQPSSSSAAPSNSPSASASPSPSASASATTSASASPTAPAPSASPTSSPTPSPTATTPEAGGPCTAAQLTGTVEDQIGGGGAGSVVRTLVLTNASDQECTVQGYPGVSFVDAAGTQLGAPADRAGSAAPLVTLAPGASATADLRQTNAENYGPDCGLTPAAGLRVYPPEATDSLILPQTVSACTGASIVLMTVGTLQPA